MIALLGSVLGIPPIFVRHPAEAYELECGCERRCVPGFCPVRHPVLVRDQLCEHERERVRDSVQPSVDMRACITVWGMV